MYNVVGIRKIDFNDKVTGNQITGHNLYVTCSSEFVKGLEGKKFFVKNSIDVSFLKPGDNIDVLFNEHGKVVSISLSK